MFLRRDTISLRCHELRVKLEFLFQNIQEGMTPPQCFIFDFNKYSNETIVCCDTPRYTHLYYYERNSICRSILNIFASSAQDIKT